MKVIDAYGDEVAVCDRHWPLAEDLFAKWGYTKQDGAIKLNVHKVENIISELSAWGIPWRREKYGEAN